MEKLRKRAIAIGATDLRKSTRKNKKWDVIYKGKTISFGHSAYEDYTQHKDKARRDRYLKRARGIRDKGGRLTHKNKNKSNFWAINILWK